MTPTQVQRVHWLATPEMELNRHIQADRTKTPVKSSTTYRGSESPLYLAVCPLVYVFRIFGIAPYEFVEDVLVPSCINSVFSFIWLGSYSYIIYSILNSFYYVDSGSTVLGHTETVKTVFNYIVAMVNTMLSFWNRQKFTRVWKILQHHDEKLQDIGYTNTEVKAVIFTWSSLATGFVIWSAISCAGMYAFAQSWLDNVSYMIIYVGTSVSVVKFSAIVLLIGERFSQLNEIAMKNRPMQRKWINSIPIVDSRTVEKLHDNLMLAGERLDEIYSTSTILWIANLSFHNVFNFYIVIHWILEGHVHWPSILCLITWIIAFTSQLILMAYACDYASSQAKAMSYIMLSWQRWLYTRDRSLVVETSLHLKNRKLNFSAGGCFNVNLPLLRTIAAVTTTYLVILLQFD